MRKNFGLIAAVLAVFAISACDTLQNSGTKQTAGGLGGAVLGGIAGAQIGSGSGRLVATGAGVLLGGLLGSEIGRSLDKADMAYANQSVNRAHNAPIGETVTWNNPESGNRGSVTPTRDGYSASGRYCREYQQTIIVGGEEQSAYGTACQQPDGSWEIVNS